MKPRIRNVLLMLVSLQLFGCGPRDAEVEESVTGTVGNAAAQEPSYTDFSGEYSVVAFDSTRAVASGSMTVQIDEDYKIDGSWNLQSMVQDGVGYLEGQHGFEGDVCGSADKCNPFGSFVLTESENVNPQASLVLLLLPDPVTNSVVLGVWNYSSGYSFGSGTFHARRNTALGTGGN